MFSRREILTGGNLFCGSMTELIQAQSLKKSYGTIQAVDDLSFEIKPGETFGLIGPNGAGKSTTIAMLIGLIQPDQGSVSVAGSSPTTPATRQKIGVAPQALSLYEELSAKENLSFFAKLYGLVGVRLSERVTWALEFAGLVLIGSPPPRRWPRFASRRSQLGYSHR